MDTPKRVVVTGYGAVSAINSADASSDVFEALLDRRDPADYESFINRTIDAFDSSDFIPERSARRMDRFTQLGYVAAHKALQRAGLDLEKGPRERVGLVLNTCYGPFESTVGYLAKVIHDGAKKAAAAVFPNTVYNAFTGRITIDLKVLGTNSTVSGYNPISYGLDMIREGLDDVMIVGGCEELIPTLSRGFEVAGHLPTSPNGDGGYSIFDGDRDLVPLGEGAAVIVLESEEFARARGATPLAEIGDYGLTSAIGESDGSFASSTRCIEVAMVQALERSGLHASDVDLVSATANGIKSLTRDEDQAISSLFSNGSRPRVSNVKMAVGETLGSATTFSTILAVGAVHRDCVPANWHLGESRLDGRYVAGESIHEPVRVALVNSVEFGGSITSTVVKKIDQRGSERSESLRPVAGRLGEG